MTHFTFNTHSYMKFYSSLEPSTVKSRAQSLNFGLKFGIKQLAAYCQVFTGWTAIFHTSINQVLLVSSV